MTVHIQDQVMIRDREIDECLQGLACGDLTFMDRLYELTSTFVYGYALSMLKSKADAEDVSQDLYVTVYTKAKLYSSHHKPMAWMLTITRNLCLARLKERNRNPLLSDEDYLFMKDETNGISVTEKEALNQALTVLNEDERQIVILHSMGFKHVEIAAITKHLLPTVITKYNRALKKLRKEISFNE